MKRKRAFKGGLRRATLEAAEKARATRVQSGKLSKYAEKNKRILPGATPPEPPDPQPVVSRMAGLSHSPPAFI